MEKKVIILDIDYTIQNNKPVVRLFSKDNDKNIILIDETFKPYLYVVSQDIENTIKLIEDNIEGVESAEKVIKKDFKQKKEFIKVTFENPQDLSRNRDAIRDLDDVIQIREYDIPFYRRYLMDNDLIPMTEVIATGDEVDSYRDLNSKTQNIQIIKLTDKLKRVNDNPQNFRILSFDLEVRNPHGMPDSKKDEIIMIGVASNFGVNEVISTKTNSPEKDNFVKQVASERDMILEFIKVIKDNNVDIIVGYNCKELRH